jgi:thymidylate kinase
MLITFSGLDGSGKSTLIDFLRDSLEKDDQKVAIAHMNYDIGLYSALRFLVDKLRGRAKVRRQTHPPRKVTQKGLRSIAARLRYQLVWNKAVRFLVYPLDVLIFLVYRFYVERLNRQVLIMDRYFYDTLVDVTGGRRSLGLRFLSWLTPTPNLSVFLDISPEEAVSRKNEYPVDYLSRRRLSYHRLMSELPDVLMLSTSQDLDFTRTYVTSAVRERMVAQ